MLPRMFGGSIEELPAFLGGVPGNSLFETNNPKVPGYVLGIAEMADRLMITPRQRMRIPVNSSSIRELMSLSRYEAELAVRARSNLEGRWLPYLLSSRSYDGNDLRWFLSSPAAAPALRAGWQYLTRDQCASIAGDIDGAWPDGVFDVDTAAALAVLSWRGGAVGLCARSLEAIMAACEQKGWSLLDIPMDTWGGLADLLVSGEPVIENHRTRFAALLEMVVDEVIKPPSDDIQMLTDLLVHALRIGAAKKINRIIPFITGMLNQASATPSRKGRDCVLLLMRWAREKNDYHLVRHLATEDRGFQDSWLLLLGATPGHSVAELDVDQIAMDLTYREAMDLHWFVDVLQQAPSETRHQKR